MDKKKYIDSIISDLEKLTRLIEIIEGQDSVSKLDLDLALDKVRQLYDNLLSLSTQEPQTITKTITEVSANIEIIEIKPAIKEEILPMIEAVKEEEPIIDEEEEQPFEFDLTEEFITEEQSAEIEEEKPTPILAEEIEPEKTEIIEETIIEKTETQIEDVQSEIISEKTEELQIKEPSTVIIEKEIKTIEPTLFGEIAVKPKEKKPTDKINKPLIEPQKTLEPQKEIITISEHLQSDKKSLNDMMATKSKDLSTTIQIKPITNIKAAIGLNDRFQFINELFLGDADLYNRTIDKLNIMSNLDEALAHINEHFEWDINNDTFKKFLDLIYRRFPMIIE